MQVKKMMKIIKYHIVLIFIILLIYSCSNTHTTVEENKNEPLIQIEKKNNTLCHQLDGDVISIDQHFFTN